MKSRVMSGVRVVGVGGDVVVIAVSAVRRAKSHAKSRAEEWGAAEVAAPALAATLGGVENRAH